MCPADDQLVSGANKHASSHCIRNTPVQPAVHDCTVQCKRNKAGSCHTFREEQDVVKELVCLRSWLQQGQENGGLQEKMMTHQLSVMKG